MLLEGQGSHREDRPGQPPQGQAEGERELHSRCLSW